VKELNALKEQAKIVNLKISEAKSENRSFDDLFKQLSNIRGLINDKNWKFPICLKEQKLK
jgi:hypothetical protein